MAALKHEIPKVEDVTDAKITALQLSSTDISLKFEWGRRSQGEEREHYMNIFDTDKDGRPLRAFLAFLEEARRSGKRFDVAFRVEPKEEQVERFAGGSDESVQNWERKYLQDHTKFMATDDINLVPGEDKGHAMLLTYPSDGNRVIMELKLSSSTPSLTSYFDADETLRG